MVLFFLQDTYYPKLSVSLIFCPRVYLLGIHKYQPLRSITVTRTNRVPTYLAQSCFVLGVLQQWGAGCSPLPQPTA